MGSLSSAGRYRSLYAKNPLPGWLALLGDGTYWVPISRAHRARASGRWAGFTGWMEHRSEGSQYLKKNTCLERVGWIWKGAMINREGDLDYMDLELGGLF